MSRESHRVSTTGLYSKSSTGMVVSLVTAVTAPSQEGFTSCFHSVLDDRKLHFCSIGVARYDIGQRFCERHGNSSK